MFLLIDNYDSFTYNLLHYLGELGADVVVRRNDEISVDEAMSMGAEGFVISPGPCDPDKAGICLDLVAAAAERHAPLFGVCQAIGQAFGGKIVGAPKPMHGKMSKITHDGSGVFSGLPSPIEATRYHSLAIDPDTLPNSLIAIAHSEDGAIQGIRHAALPIHGVQFHPESIASEHGHDILRNFIEFSRGKEAA
jgi:anthranilate synthase component 2